MTVVVAIDDGAAGHGTSRCPKPAALRRFAASIALLGLLATATSAFGAEPASGPDDPESAPAAAAPVADDFSRLIFEAEILTVAPDASDASLKSSAGGAAVAPGPAATDADPTAAARINADIDRYEGGIGTTLEASGPYSDQLREQYLSLGELYQQQGDHEKAITAFESAMHIDRVNDGLFTLRQLPLVQNIIESYAALADFDELNDHHEYLYYIQQKSYAEDDPRLLAAKEDWADWNVQSYLKEGVVRNGFNPAAAGTVTMGGNGNDYVAVQNPRNGNVAYVPRNQMNNVLNPGAVGTNATLTDFYMRSASFGVTPEQLVDERLNRARDLYEEILESSKSDVGDRSIEVQHKLANIAYAVKRQLEAMQSSSQENSLNFNRITAPEPSLPLVSQGYSNNREALEEIAMRLAEDPDRNAVALAQAYINLGDWNLAYDRPQRGRDEYEKALAVLAEAGLPADEISRIFNPSPLVPLPGFALHPYSRPFYGIAATAPLARAGHVDMTLTVNNYGTVRSPRVTAVSPGTSQRLRSLLLNYLRNQPMRPLVQNGSLMKESELTLRIHYSY